MSETTQSTSKQPVPALPINATLGRPALLGRWRWTLAGLCVVTGVLLGLALAYLHWQTLGNGRRLTETFGLVVAQETSRTLQTVDQRLELTALKLTTWDAAGPKAQALVNAAFKAEIQTQPFLRAMWLLDDRGVVQYDSDPLNTVSDDGLPGGDVDYVALFAAQPKRDFHIGIPARGGQKNAWLIHAARPLRSTSGAVTGVLVAAIDPNYFADLWQALDIGTEGSIALLTRNGVLMMRSPFVAAVMGKSFNESPIFRVLLKAQPHGNNEDFSPIDSLKRMYSFRTLPAQPDLVVIVGQSFAQVLVPWWRWVWLVSLVWGAAWLGIFAIAYRLDREWRLRYESEGLLRTSETQYESLFVNAMDAIFLTAPDGGILSANPAACAMFGRTEPEMQAVGRQGLLDTTDPNWHAVLKERVRNGKFQGELRCVKKGGDIFSGEVSSSEFLDQQGKARTTLIVRDVTQRNQSALALRQYAEQLQTLSRRVIETQEAERRRLASELHDELGQSLTAIKINLQAGAKFKDRSPAELNAENIRIVEDTLQQVRRLALALRPSILDNLGLVPALNSLGKQAALRNHLHFRFQSMLLPHRVAPELETTCFRIAQEALTNMARHAAAQRFSITIEQDDKTLVMTIQDDGVGMDWPAVQAKAQAGGSFGVLGMVERAALVSGELQVCSSAGKGCTLVLRCPIPDPLESP